MTPFPYRIERTRNRHSRAVHHDGTIVIRLARGLPAAEERSHIESLLRRMTKMLERDARKTRIDPFRPLLNGGSSLSLALCTGHSVHFNLSPGRRTMSRRAANGWNVIIGPGLQRKALHRFLWRLLSASALNDVEERVHAINDATLRVRVRGVKLRFAKTQWGSCSPNGMIALNPALLFLPPPVLEYVIVHELAHRIAPDHSARFWRTVESAMPDYATAYRRLRESRLPML